MSIESLLSPGATINPLLRQAGLSEDYIKENRDFWSQWAWDDGNTAVVTVWVDERDPVTGETCYFDHPSLVERYGTVSRRHAEQRFDILTRRNGQSVRVLLQRKKTDGDTSSGRSAARGLDPEPWFVRTNSKIAKLQRGVPFGPPSTRDEDIDLSKFVLGHTYTRPQIAELGQVTPPESIFATSWSQGILEFANAVLLFVTLEKEIYTYEDYFDGALFHWQSQSRQTQNTPLIRQILAGETPCYLFARIHAKTGNRAEPFVYCGALSVPTATGNKPVSCVFRSLDFLEGAIGEIGKLYSWKSSHSESKESVERRHDIERFAAKGGQGRQPDTDLRIAVEWYAMAKAREHYVQQEWEVQDTSANRPYDLFCTRGAEKRRVEVKGTTTAGESVLVTVGEVNAALEPSVDTDLFIVRNVKVVRSGSERHLSGGEVSIVSPWRPCPEELKPTQFVCSVSKGTEA